MTIVRSQIFSVLACAFSAGIFVTFATDHLARGSMALAALDIAVVTINLFASITLAIKLFRAMPAP
jgi:hypothetical protein